MSNMHAIRVYPTLLTLLTLASCSTELRETARIISPDGHAVAVLIWVYGGGAAGSATRHIYIAEANAKSFEHPILSTTHCESLSMSWTDSNTLQVNYESNCSIKAFENHWYSPAAIQNAQPATVEIILNRKAL